MYLDRLLHKHPVRTFRINPSCAAPHRPLRESFARLTSLKRSPRCRHGESKACSNLPHAATAFLRTSTSLVQPSESTLGSAGPCSINGTDRNERARDSPETPTTIESRSNERTLTVTCAQQILPPTPTSRRKTLHSRKQPRPPYEVPSAPPVSTSSSRMAWTRRRWSTSELEYLSYTWVVITTTSAIC